jgi:hypothetical protein
VYTHHDVEALRASLEADVGIRVLQRALAAVEPYRDQCGAVDFGAVLYPVVVHGNDRVVGMLTDLVRAEQQLG